MRGDVGDVDPDADSPPSSRSALIASSKSRAVGGSIVNVGSVAQVAARTSSTRGALRRVARLALDQRVEAAPQPAVEHQRLEHVARDVRAADPRAPPAAVAAARPLGATSTRSPTPAVPLAACRR